MTAPAGIEVPVQRRRLAAMLAVNFVCVVVGASAAVGGFAYHIGWLVYVFAAALLTGFAAHIWLMLGLARSAGPKGSV
jgi:hypothetical protein